MTDRLRAPRLPAHVLVMMSAATAGYAVTLAGVTHLQAADEAALAAERAPAAARIAALTAGHDDLLARVESAREAYHGVAALYSSTAAALDSVDRALAGLASEVAEIDGVSRSLPTSVRMPAPQTVVRVSAPTTHATTGASGG